MGLLEMMNSDQGLLGLHLMAAAAPRERRVGFGEGLLGGLQGVQAQRAAEEDRKARRQMQEMQMRQQQMQLAALEAEQRKQQGVDQAFRGAMRTPEQAAMQKFGGPTVAAAQAAPGMAPQIDQAALLRGLMQADPRTAFQMLQPKPDDYKVVGGSLVAVGPGGVREAYRAPDKPAELPSAVREYEFARQQGYPGSFQQFQIEQRRAGAPSVSVNTEKPFMTSLAQGLGKQLDDGLAAARSAATSVGTAQTLRRAAESGNVLAGPGANFGVLGLQLGQMLGVSGKDQQEKLLNTRTAIQAMAKAELDAAQMMKGQGQITEAERDIIRRAAAGDITSLTAPELSLLAQAMEKTGRAKIAAHQANVQRLGQMPGAQPLMPFYGVDMPPEYQGPAPSAPAQPASTGWGIRPLGGS